MPAKMVAMPGLMMRERLLLLEEGYCLKDQVLGVPGLRKKQNVSASGAANLSTIVQVVA